MKLYVYADESGTFDKMHNDLFVYGGLILIGFDAKEAACQRYSALEKSIRNAHVACYHDSELKASVLSLRERKRLFTSIERPGCHQFSVMIDQAKLHNEIFTSKKRKQCFLDYALKRGIKTGIVDALRINNVKLEEVDSVSVVVDEHSTSTSGKYNLSESINAELRDGTFNPTWNKFFPPLFTHGIPEIPVCYVDSSKVTLIRAADITANWAFMAMRDRKTYPRALEMLKEKSTVFLLP